jgi:signal transduction histidine kinase
MNYRLKKEIKDKFIIEEKLKALNETLEIKIKHELERRTIQDKALEQQTKMAAMGEMMDAVAHQWKQPLNAITLYNSLLKSDFQDGIVDQKYINDFLDNTTMQINHMVNTLDEFRRFFRDNQNIEKINIKKSIESLQRLIKDDFLKNHINIEVKVDNNSEIKIKENEFKHLILNIINNSKDAFNENKIEKRVIKITSKNINKKNILIEFEDNAGGIPSNIINDIFKPNVTTKSPDKGTGIGLYMTMQIVKKYHGTLSVKNTLDGAIFSLILPLSEA